MQISADIVARFHYVISNEKGDVLESSAGSDPMTYLHGKSALLPGLETAMVGKTTGDKFSVTLPPEQAFGERRAESEMRVPIKHLQGAKKWKPGMQAVVQTEQGQQQVSVVKVGHTMATIDTNHPLAGQTIVFDVEVMDVREASAEELSHGHAHGPGGHEH